VLLCTRQARASLTIPFVLVSSPSTILRWRRSAPIRRSLLARLGDVGARGSTSTVLPVRLTSEIAGRLLALHRLWLQSVSKAGVRHNHGSICHENAQIAQVVGHGSRVVYVDVVVSGLRDLVVGLAERPSAEIDD
jgi:hypothetical protein